MERINILDEYGHKVAFKSLWRDSRVTIIFLRHFGCISCRAHVSQVLDEMNKKKLNSKVVFIGNGSPQMIKVFKADMNIGAHIEIYTDPSLESYDACGLNRGLGYLMNIKSARSMKSLMSKGYKNDLNLFNTDNGAHTQMGGIVVLSAPGKVHFHFSSEYLGDVPERTEDGNDLGQRPRP